MKKGLRLNVLFLVSLAVLIISGCGAKNFIENVLKNDKLPPKNVMASAGDSSTDISWNTVESATGYNLYWSTTPGVDKNDRKIASVTTPYSHTGLTNDTTYYYVVTSKSNLGESEVSLEVSATPNAEVPDIEAPDATSDTPSTPDTSGWVKETPNTSFPSRTYHQVVAFKNKMYLLGGTVANTEIGGIWISTDGVNWQKTEVGDFSKLSDHQVVVFGDKMYVIGGYRSRSGLPRVTCCKIYYSADGESWEDEEVLPESGIPLGRHGHRIVVFKDKMYLIAGGDNDNLKADVWSSADGITWTEENDKAPFATRSGHQVVVFNDKMYLIAGYSDGEAKNDIWSSSDGKDWQREVDEASFSVRYGHQVVVFKNKMYLIGGIGKSKNQYRFIESDIWSSADGITWIKETAPPSAARYGHQVVVFNGKMYLIAGSGSDGAKNDIWSYAGK